MKEKKWRIELTEHQLRLMAQCIEDCHRFIAGQTELINSTACLIKHYRELSEDLVKLQPLVTPLLGRGESYGWDGGYCPNDYQRKFIAETYPICREIFHKILNVGVYTHPTMTCEEGGPLPIIEEINE